MFLSKNKKKNVNDIRCISINQIFCKDYESWEYESWEYESLQFNQMKRNIFFL